jgi:hypothetical protein
VFLGHFPWIGEVALLVFINLSLVLVATYYMPTSLSITCTRLSSLMMMLKMLVGTT